MGFSSSRPVLAERPFNWHNLLQIFMILDLNLYIVDITERTC